MENLKLTQANFTAGEVSPTLLARDDIQQYAYGASKLRNVVVTPHGGVRRRPGLRFDEELQRSQFDTWVIPGVSGTGKVIDYTAGAQGTFTTGTFATASEILVVRQKDAALETYKGLCVLVPGVDFTLSGDDITIVGDSDNGDIIYFVSNKASGLTTSHTEDIVLGDGNDYVASIPFSFSTEQEYLVVITAFCISIYRDEGAGDYILQRRLACPMATNSIETVTYSQSLDTLLIFQKNHCTLRLRRTGNHTSWALDSWPYEHIPEYDFQDQYSPGGSHGTAPSPVATNHVERMRFEISGGRTDNRFTIFVNGEETEEFIFDASASTAPILAANVLALETAIEALEGFEAGDITATNVAPKEYNITFGGTAVGKTHSFLAGSTSFTASGNSLLFLTKTKGQGEMEPAFSERRGFPRCGTFFAGRLWVGGCLSLPQSLFSSRSGNYYDFNSTETFADYGIYYTMDTDSVSAIYNIYAGRHLTILSSSAEFYDPSSLDGVPTPETFFTRRTTRRGSLEGLPAFDVQGGLVFVERYGKSIMEIVFEETNQSYNSTSLTTLAPHLITTPVDMAFRTAISVEEADYLYVVNDDGSMATFCTLRNERVNAWSLTTTEGNFRNVAVVGSDTMVVVVRNIDGTDRFFLEHFDDDLYMDSADSGLSGVSSTTGLAHLTAESCDLLLDGNLQDQVVASGTTQLGATTATSWQAGLPFPDVSGAGLGWQTWIQTLPYQSGPDSPSLRGGRQGVADVYLRVYNTSALSVRSGEGSIHPIRFRNLGSVLGSSIPVYSGEVEKRGIQGFIESSQLSIIQTDSLPMHVLGVTQKVTI